MSALLLIQLHDEWRKGVGSADAGLDLNLITLMSAPSAAAASSQPPARIN
jgi:hypothetical protein